MKKQQWMFAVLAACMASGAPATLAAQIGAGHFDPDFGDQSLRMGVAHLGPAVDQEDRDSTVLIDAGGNIIYAVARCQEPCDDDVRTVTVTRLDAASGNVDVRFGVNGFVEIAGVIQDSLHLAMDASGRLLIANSVYVTETTAGVEIRRFDASGQVDALFATNGVFTFSPPPPRSGEAPPGYFVRAVAAAGDAIRFAYTAPSNGRPDTPGQMTIAGVTATGEIDTRGFIPYQTGEWISKVFRFAVDASNRPVFLAQSDLGFAAPFLARVQATGMQLDSTFNPCAGFGCSSGRMSGFDLFNKLDFWQDVPLQEIAVLNDFVVDGDNLAVAAAWCCENGDRRTRAAVVRLDEVGDPDETFSSGDFGAGVIVVPSIVDPWGLLLARGTGGRAVLNGYGMSGNLEARFHYFFEPDGSASAGYGNAVPGLVTGSPIKVSAAPSATSVALNDGALHETGELTLADGAIARGISRHLASGETRDVDIEPDVIVIPVKTGVMPDTWVDSDPVVIAGIDTAAIISVENGNYLVDGDYRTEPGAVRPGGEIVIRHQSASGVGEEAVSTLHVGPVTADFVSRTADDTPDNLAFAPAGKVAPGATVTSAAVVLDGMDSVADISVENGVYVVGGQEYAEAGRIDPATAIALRHRAPLEPGVTTVTTLTIGAAVAEFVSETGDNVPDAVAFESVTDAETGVLVESAAVALTGFDMNILVGVAPGDASGIEISVNDGAYSAATQEIAPGANATLRVRLAASDESGSERTGAIFLGREDNRVEFTVTTAAEDGDPDPEPEPQPEPDAPAPSGGGGAGYWTLAMFGLALARRRRNFR